MRELNEKDKTTLNENAAIYGKRDERGAFEKFKELKGAAKWEFFRDYFLWKLVAAAAGVVVIVLILVKILGPQQETLVNIAVLDDPFSQVAYDIYDAKLNAEFVTDEKLERVSLDTAYYVTSDGYNARTRIMTYVAAGEIDFMILPVREYDSYRGSEMFADLAGVLSPEYFDSLSDILVYSPTYHDDDEPDPGTQTCYAVNITGRLNEMNGFELAENYYMVCVVNSKHKENLETSLKLLLND